MGKPYSEDLRTRVIAAVDAGAGAYAVAPVFRVSVSYIYKALIRRRTTGEVTARPSGGGPKPKLAVHDDALRAAHRAARPSPWGRRLAREGSGDRKRISDHG